MQGALRGLPLALTAAKSRMGHSEFGAGVLGMLHASIQLAEEAASLIAHLRAPNPYVTGALDSTKLPVALPRGAAPSISASLGDSALALSSFAFQVHSKSSLLASYLHFTIMAFQ